MSVLVYTESENGKFKKAAFEAASYAKGIADQLGTSVTAVSINAEDDASLGQYGVSKVLKVSNDKLAKFNADAYADVLTQAAKNEDAKAVVLSQTANDKYLAPVLAVNLEAGYASNIVALPESTEPFTVKRTAFTNKAFNFSSISSEVKILGISKNAYGLKENETDSEIVKQIKELIDTRVRPAVAMDGGDIVFQGFKKGIVYLHMQGACSGCPSSLATLKMGVENMLKHYVPEVMEVKEVS